MHRVIWLLVWTILIPIIAITIYGLTSQYQTKKLHEELVVHVSHDNFYTSFVSDYFSMYRKSLGRVCVNQKFEYNCLNILVIDVKKKTDKLYGYQENIFAVGKNLIIIGKDFFDLLLISSNYSFKSQMAIPYFGNSSSSPLATNVLWAQRYTDIIRDHRNGGYGFVSEADRIKRGIIGMKSLDSKDIPTNILKFGDPRKLASIIQVAGFGLFIEHEIGHLAISPAERLWLRLKSSIQNGFLGNTKLEEDLVDDMAYDTLNKTMTKIVALSPQFVEGSNIELSALFTNFQFFWVDGMYEYFQNFRKPIVAEDFLYEIDLDKCSYDGDLLQMIPDETFVIVPIMRRARLKPLPVLTKDEFDNLSFMLNSVTTHTHSTIRAEHLFDQIHKNLSNISGEDIDQEGLGIMPSLIELARTHGLINTSNIHSSLPTILLESQLISTFEKAGVTLQQGYLCPTQNCMVVAKDGTYLEVLSNGKSVIEIRLIAPFTDSKIPLLAKEVLKLIAKSINIKHIKINSIVENISDMCPGSYEVIETNANNELVYINRMATPNYVMVRYFHPIL